MYMIKWISNRFRKNSVINCLVNPESHYFVSLPLLVMIRTTLPARFVPVVSLPPLVMINQNHPPNSLINVIRKKYNSCDGGISNRITTETFLKHATFLKIKGSIKIILYWKSHCHTSCIFSESH